MPDPTDPINNQDGIEEIYFGKLLPEISPGMPYWGSLSEEQRDYYTSSNNPNDPIRRAIAMQAREGYGIDGNPTFSQSVENTVKRIPGAIGESVMEILGAPQAGAVELAKEIVPGGKRGDIRNVLPGLTSSITGDATARQELPSEYIGFKNPEGFWQHAANLGIDAVTDPVDLIGGGMLLDGLKLLPKGVKSIDDIAALGAKKAKEYKSYLTSNIPKSSTELANTGFKIDPYYHAQKFFRKKDEIGKAIRTDEGRKRIQAYIDKNPHLQNKTVDDIINDFENTTFETKRPIYDEQKDEWITNDLGEKIYFDADPNNAYNWYRDGYDKPSYISMGQNYTPYDALHILEHEFAHLFQRGEDIAGVDDVLGWVKLKNNAQLAPKPFQDFFNRYNPFKTKDVGYSVTGDVYGTGVKNLLERSENLKSQMDYFLTGAGRGQEKAAFAAEVRENLMQRGILENRYDKITPEMLEKHFKLYHNTKGSKYQLRLYDIMQNNKNNFKLLSRALNRMPAVVPPAAIVGAGAAGSATDPDIYEEGGDVEQDPVYSSVGTHAINDSNIEYIRNRKRYLPEKLSQITDRESLWQAREGYYKYAYNTPLTDDEQALYDIWYPMAVDSKLINPMDHGVYDIPGFWKSGEWKSKDSRGHGTDTFKKPNHITFSNESKWSSQQGGSPFEGGTWDREGSFIPGRHNFYSNEEINFEFNREREYWKSKGIKNAVPEHLYGTFPKLDTKEEVMMDNTEVDATLIPDKFFNVEE